MTKIFINPTTEILFVTPLADILKSRIEIFIYEYEHLKWLPPTVIRASNLAGILEISMKCVVNFAQRCTSNKVCHMGLCIIMFLICVASLVFRLNCCV
jgi:hypothetical protein